MPRRVYGSGSITKKGYIRINNQMAHRRVWEGRYGAVPKGFCIHHINGDKQDNRIENLTILDYLTHKRIHSGCKIVGGKWWKPCRKCGELKRVDTDYYGRKDGISAWCKSCCVENAVANEKRRKLESTYQHT